MTTQISAHQSTGTEYLGTPCQESVEVQVGDESEEENPKRHAQGRPKRKQKLNQDRNDHNQHHDDVQHPQLHFLQSLGTVVTQIGEL